MPKICLYWSFMSQPARALKCFLLDACIEHEERHLDLQKEEHKSPQLMAINPAGTVPFITFDGQCMVETVAIMRFLSEVCGDKACKYYSQEPLQQFHIDKWCDFYADAFRPAFLQHFAAIFEKGDGPLTDKQRLMFERSAEKQEKVLQKVEARFEEGCKFIAGDCLSIADYVLFSELYDTKYMSLDISGYPRICKYMNDVLKCSKGACQLFGPDSMLMHAMPMIQQFFKIEDDEANNIWYFGVGTMLNATRLDNMGLTPIRSCPGELLDHRHYFYDKPGMSESIPCKGESFHGVIHLMTPEKIAMLDKMMAGHYIHVSGKVRLYNGTCKDVIHYIRPEGEERNSDVDGPPDARFLDIMIEGCKHYNVNADFIKWLENYPNIPRHNPANYACFPCPPDGSKTLSKA